MIIDAGATGVSEHAVRAEAYLRNTVPWLVGTLPFRTQRNSSECVLLRGGNKQL